MNNPKAIPIIDLFAGPGGLGEGFSRYPLDKKEKNFRIVLSFEKDPFAHRTLTTRAFFRQFPEGEAPDDYYVYLRGEIDRDELFKRHPIQAAAAKEEAQLRTLGKDPMITQMIGEAIKGHDKWVLIGGPPCQAYSLVGRSRMLGLVKVDDESDELFNERKKQRQQDFEEDHRHTLYLEYLKIIADHSPPVFVMENVKGILSASLKEELIFPKILNDLRDPWKALKRKGSGPIYKILSLVKNSSDSSGTDLKSSDFLIRAEEYGIPQTRHRVILLGVRDDLIVNNLPTLRTKIPVPIEDVIDGLPHLTPGLSKRKGVTPFQALSEVFDQSWWQSVETNPTYFGVCAKMRQDIKRAIKEERRGIPFQATQDSSLDSWYRDSRLKGVCNHETRSHIREDLWRYFFCACYAATHGEVAPSLRDFPKELLPKHRNVEDAVAGQKFGDRFRVQCKGRPATTVTSHISKDGHYFIHYDARQYRSLTVREAARIQTFPDNYFFEGPRTQQFHQVGNAVPPMLALKIANVAASLL